jgi:hypothetical protein
MIVRTGTKQFNDRAEINPQAKARRKQTVPDLF